MRQPSADPASGSDAASVWHNRAAAVDAPFENARSAAPRSWLWSAAIWTISKKCQ
jgi:hypothetical protein